MRRWISSEVLVATRRVVAGSTRAAGAANLCSVSRPTLPFDVSSMASSLVVLGTGETRSGSALFGGGARGLRALDILALIYADDVVEHRERLGLRALERISSDDRAGGAAVAQAPHLGVDALEILGLAAREHHHAPTVEA